MTRHSLIALACGVAALGAALVAPASRRAEIDPLAGLVMLTAGCLMLGRPLAGPLTRLVATVPVLGTMRSGGIALLVAAMGCALVLGPVSGLAALPLVLALLGVSLLAIGSTPSRGRGLGMRGEPVDLSEAEPDVAPKARPPRARAA